jgi:hypothetical protein
MIMTGGLPCEKYPSGSCVAVFSLLICVIATLAQAQAPKASKETMAMANMIDHAADCYTYFAVLAQCLRNRDPSDKLIKTIEQQSQRTLEIAFAFSQTVGVKPEAWAAKTKYTLKRHIDRMNNDCLNISVLFEPYTEQCKRLVANPDIVLKEFLR